MPNGDRDGEIGNGEEEVCACIYNIINGTVHKKKMTHLEQRERASDKLAIIFFKFKTWREIPEPQ